MAQSIKRVTLGFSGSGHDLRVVLSGPVSGLALGMEPT